MHKVKLVLILNQNHQHIIRLVLILLVLILLVYQIRYFGNFIQTSVVSTLCITSHLITVYSLPSVTTLFIKFYICSLTLFIFVWTTNHINTPRTSSVT